MVDKKIFAVIAKINGEERLTAAFADNLIQVKKQLEDSGFLVNHEVIGIRVATKSDLEQIVRLMYSTILDLATRKKDCGCHKEGHDDKR